MNDSLDDVLHRYFDDVARDDRLGDTPIRVVMRRGQRRRARRRTGAMAGTLVVGALGSVVAVRTLSGGDSDRRVSIGSGESDGSGGGTPAPVPTDGTAQLAPSPLVWNEVTVGSAEAIVQTWGPDGLLVADDGTFYALSTQPGRSDQPQSVLYRSTDGLHWEPTGSAPDQLAGRSTLTLAADRLYAVGTMAATAPTSATPNPGTAAIASSDDGGSSWDERPLPIDLTSISALPAVRSVSLPTSVAGNADRVVVAGVSQANLDAAQLVPPGVDADTFSIQPDLGGGVEYAEQPCEDMAPPTTSPAEVGAEATTTTTWPAGAAQDASTTSVIGASRVTEDATATTVNEPPYICRMEPVRTYTWAELGVSEQTAAAAVGQLHVAVSVGGGDFTAVTPPAMPEGWLVQQPQLVTTHEGFVLVVDLHRTTELSMATSPGRGEQQVLAFTSTDGQVWEPLELPLRSVEQLGTLADGTLVATGWDGGDSTVVATRSDGTWQVSPVFDIATPDGMRVMSSFGRTSIGDAGIALVVEVAVPIPASASATPVASDGVIPESTAPAALEFDPTTRRTLVVYSSDGITWSTDDITDLVGDDHYLQGVRVAGAQVIVDLSTAALPPVSEPLPDHTLLVGTPA